MNSYKSRISKFKRHEVGKQMVTSGDNIYLDIIIPHDNTGGSTAPSPAEFDENRTEAIVDNPSDYYLSLIRFSVPGYDIPIFIFKVQVNQPNVDLGVYSVTLDFNGDIQQAFLIFDSRDATVVPPVGPVGPVQDETFYYYIFDYQHMIDMINTAFSTAFAALAAPPVGSVAPYMIWDETNQIFSLIAQTAFYDTTLATPIKVYFNEQLSLFFVNFPVFNFGDGNPDGLDKQILITDYKNNFYNEETTAPAFPPPFYQIVQQWQQSASWNDFKNLVFLTGTIPVRSEYIPVSGAEENFFSSQANNNFRPILTDFEPIIEKAGDVRSVFQYFPQGPYRLVDLTSTGPLNKFDVQVYWQDKLNVLRRLFIPFGQVVTIKLAFFRKDLFLTPYFEMETLFLTKQIEKKEKEQKKKLGGKIAYQPSLAGHGQRPRY